MKYFKSACNKIREKEKKKKVNDESSIKNFKTIDMIYNNYPKITNSVSPELCLENPNFQTDIYKVFTPNNKTNLFLKSNKSAHLKSRNVVFRPFTDNTLSLKSIKSAKKKDILINVSSPICSKKDLREIRSSTNVNEKIEKAFDGDEILNIISINYNSKREFYKILYKVNEDLLSYFAKTDERFSYFIKKSDQLWEKENERIENLIEENEKLKEQILYYEDHFEEMKRGIENKYYDEKEELKYKIVVLEDNLKKLNSLKISRDITISEIKVSHESAEISIYNPHPKDQSNKELISVPKLDLRKLPKNELLDSSKANNMENQLTTLSNPPVVNNNENNKFKRNIKLISGSTDKNKSAKQNLNIQFDNKKAIKNIKNLIKKDNINFFNKMNLEITRKKSNNKIISHKRVFTESKLIDYLANPPVVVNSRNLRSFTMLNNTENLTLQNKNFTMQ